MISTSKWKIVEYVEFERFIEPNPFIYSIFINTHVIIKKIYQSKIQSNVVVMNVGHFGCVSDPQQHHHGYMV